VLELLGQLDFPLAAPSANPIGYISPTRPALSQLGGRIPYVLDSGPCQASVESTAQQEGSLEQEVLLVPALPAGIRKIDLTDCRREFQLVLLLAA
jgi:L-threonylcarbamoyladenylate synthase